MKASVKVVARHPLGGARVLRDESAEAPEGAVEFVFAHDPEDLLVNGRLARLEVTVTLEETA